MFKINVLKMVSICAQRLYIVPKSVKSNAIIVIHIMCFPRLFPTRFKNRDRARQFEAEVTADYRLWLWFNGSTKK